MESMETLLNPAAQDHAALLTQALINRNYSAAYALLGREDRFDLIHVPALLEHGISCTIKLFRTMLDKLFTDDARAKLANDPHWLDGPLLTAFQHDRDQHLAALLELGIDPNLELGAAPDLNPRLKLRILLGIMSGGGSSMLAWAVGLGAVKCVRPLLDHPGTRADTPGVRAIILRVLYAGGENPAPMWAAQTVLDALMDIPSPMDYPAPEELTGWMRAQALTAPPEQLGRFIRDGVYTPEQLLPEYPMANPMLCREHHARLCAILTAAAQVCPAFWRGRDAVDAFARVMALADKPDKCQAVLEMAEVVAASLDRPVTIASQKDGSALLCFRERSKLLTTFSQGCGLAIRPDALPSTIFSGDTLAWYVFHSGDASAGLPKAEAQRALADLLRCAHIIPTRRPRKTPSNLALLLLEVGNVPLFRLALKKGLLAQEPLPALLQKAEQIGGDADALLPLMLMALPSRQKTYDL